MPPSSIDALITCGAHSSSRRRPTAVEPVNDSLRTRGSLRTASASGAGSVRADDVDDALRHARLFEQPHDRQRRQGRLLRGLEHDRAARGERRPELARGHRRREVPGRDQQRDPDRRVRDEHPVGYRPGRSRTRRSRAPPPPRTSAGTRRHRPSRRAPRPAACPSHARSGARPPRCVRSSGRTRGGGSRRARAGRGRPSPPAAASAASTAAIPSSGRADSRLSMTEPSAGSTTANCRRSVAMAMAGHYRAGDEKCKNGARD